MSEEIIEFVNTIGALDLRRKLQNSKYRGIFKRRNYFLLNNDKFLIVKISRSKIKPFWGLGKQFYDFFNMLTEKNQTYFFVALISNKSGWVIPKREIISQIADGSISYSINQKQYKINSYNLKDRYSFTSINSFFNKINQLN